MKLIKRLLIALILLGLIGAGVYIPLSRHLVTFQSKQHLIERDSYSFQNFSINLDNNPKEWKLVLESPSLRSYFLTHYRQQILQRMKKMGKSWLDRLKEDGKKVLDKARKKLQDEAKKQGSRAVEQLKKKGKKGLNTLKKKADKLLE
jgi:hypothetical protein